MFSKTILYILKYLRIDWNTLASEVGELVRFEDPEEEEIEEEPAPEVVEEEAKILPSTRFVTSVMTKDTTPEIVLPNQNNQEVSVDTCDYSTDLSSDIMIKALGLKVIPDCEDVFDYQIHKLNIETDHKDFETINKLSNIQLQIQELGYSEAPNIHSLQARNFYKNILKCSPTINTLLESGYIPRFHTQPEHSYQENNNASALRHASFVRYCLFSFQIV